MDLNFSVGRIILLTYIIIASGYCTNLFSNGLKNAIQNNKYAQHIILILLIMALMICFGNPFGVEITSNQQVNIVIMSLLVYVWFIMTTKLDLAWNIGILILLTIYFLYESKQISDYKAISLDPQLDLNKKKNILDTYISTQKYILVAIFGVTIVGTLVYANEKQEQYGGGFSINKFIFS
jgi:hypothetical protein